MNYKNQNDRSVFLPKKSCMDFHGIRCTAHPKGRFLITISHSQLLSQADLVELLSDLGDMLGHREQCDIIKNWNNFDRV